MNISSPFRFVRRAALCSCLAMSFAAVACAEDLPKFSDPAVNEFVKKYDELIGRMVKDIKANDEAKMTKDGDDQSKLMADTDKIQDKVKPEEADAWAKFLTGEVDRLGKAAQ